MPLRGGRGRREPADVVALVRELGTLLVELGLSEVEIDRAGVKVRVQRGGGGAAPAAAVHAAPVPAGTTAVAPAVALDAATPGHVTIEAPMVGTFYRASSPTAEPYVREGELVKQGQILCIIEAMKLMNEIESKVSGRIVKIVVENAQPVEYGQPLFLIDGNA
ncbi:MAG: acetyl-CoA carboxylase biotin carboxyl carrier protein [Candidatus Rokubacteria bacterium]|nr:acetyl-CoA carboxylase biotin carboxyl carrier protein [Candidatus Rokubacteria bacterium]